VSWRALLEVALPLFLIMDPVGNAAVCVAILAGEPPRRQRAVILRELFIALGIVVAFFFAGEALLAVLDIRPSTLRLAGGVILFIISLKLVYPPREGELEAPIRDPFIVPIAVPSVAGPSLLTAVALYGRQAQGHRALVLAAILAAWVPTAAIMACAPGLTRLLGPRATRAAARLMGLILVLLAVQMLEDGVRLFVASLAE
jgi:multiple antibiotic resistance protein